MKQNRKTVLFLMMHTLFLLLERSDEDSEASVQDAATKSELARSEISGQYRQPVDSSSGEGMYVLPKGSTSICSECKDSIWGAVMTNRIFLVVFTFISITCNDSLSVQ